MGWWNCIPDGGVLCNKQEIRERKEYDYTKSFARNCSVKKEEKVLLKRCILLFCLQTKMSVSKSEWRDLKVQGLKLLLVHEF